MPDRNGFPQFILFCKQQSIVQALHREQDKIEDFTVILALR